MTDDAFLSRFESLKQARVILSSVSIPCVPSSSIPSHGVGIPEAAASLSAASVLSISNSRPVEADDRTPLPPVFSVQMDEPAQHSHPQAYDTGRWTEDELLALKKAIEITGDKKIGPETLPFLQMFVPNRSFSSIRLKLESEAFHAFVRLVRKRQFDGLLLSQMCGDSCRPSEELQQQRQQPTRRRAVRRKRASFKIDSSSDDEASENDNFELEEGAAKRSRRGKKRRRTNVKVAIRPEHGAEDASARMVVKRYASFQEFKHAVRERAARVRKMDQELLLGEYGENNKSGNEGMDTVRLGTTSSSEDGCESGTEIWLPGVIWIESGGESMDEGFASGQDCDEELERASSLLF
eukprot:ANDGO_06461.mRNA.1 hypothetical protein